MAQLVIYDNIETKETPHIFELLTNRVLIGSSPDSQLILEDSHVATAHISLEFRQSYWVLQDLGSEIGTIINNEPVNEPHPLDHDDLIQISGIKIQFQDDIYEDDSEDTETSVYTTDEDVKGRIWLAKVGMVTLGVIIIIFMSLLASGANLEDLFGLF
ncbi:FHA domain-containing protein [Anaerolineales bacterium HSG6]|nr:FHA domain-containing protein [Anaerolineales bacterium HSG6]MDM8532652.1 FHA domain-containing protein [Anaerolineales bacterium HSG25]